MEKQILISCIQDLEQLRKLKPHGEYVVRMTSDLDFSALNYMSKAECKESFQPIDLSKFEGVLFIKGENHTIKGFKVITKDSDYVGFFSKISPNASVEIRNLTFEDPIIQGRVSVGVIAGQGPITLRGCNIIGGTITGTSVVGAYTGFSQMIRAFSCEASTCVTSRTLAGSFVGVADRAMFQNCATTSLVTTSKGYEMKFCGLAWDVTEVESVTRQVSSEYTRIYPDKSKMPQVKKKKHILE